MPLFEVEHAGKMYDVMAPNAEEAGMAFDPPHQTPPQPNPTPSLPAGWSVKPGEMIDSKPLKPWAQIGRDINDTAGEVLIRAREGVEDLIRTAYDASQGGGNVARNQNVPHTQQLGDFKRQVEDRRAEFMRNHPGFSEGALDFAAGMVPVTGAVGSVKNATTLLGAVGRTVASGTVASGAQFTKDGDSKAQQMLVGGALAGTVGAVAGVAPAGFNRLGRMIETARQGSPRVAAVRALAKEAGATTPLSIGQETGAPKLIQLERMYAGQKAQNLQADRVDEARRLFEGYAADAERLSQTRNVMPDNATGAVNNALNSTVNRMRATRSAAFKAGTAEVDALDAATPAGRRPAIPLSNLQHAYSEILSIDSNAFNIHGETLPESIKDTFEQMRRWATVARTPSVRIRISALHDLMAGLGQDAPHGAATFLDPKVARLEMFRNKLKAALDEDIEAAGVTEASSPAFRKLMEVRKTYAQQSDQLRRLENDSLASIFGSPEKLTSPQAALDRFYALRSADQRYAVNLLESQHPQVLAAMRAQRIRTAMTDATRAGNAKDSSFDLSAFNESLFGGDAANSPLWGGDSALTKKMQAGGAHLKLLLNSPAVGNGSGSVVGGHEVVTNAISRNATFVSRLVSRVAFGPIGDEMLGTPEGLAALRELARPTAGRKSQTYAAAMAWMVNHAQMTDEASNRDQ